MNYEIIVQRTERCLLELDQMSSAVDRQAEDNEGNRFRPPNSMLYSVACNDFGSSPSGADRAPTSATSARGHTRLMGSSSLDSPPEPCARCRIQTTNHEQMVARWFCDYSSCVMRHIRINSELDIVAIGMASFHTDLARFGVTARTLRSRPAQEAPWWPPRLS